LEVVDETGTSTVWDDTFEADDAALAEFRRYIDLTGAAEILDQEPVRAI
jgi:hypothetical protein